MSAGAGGGEGTGAVAWDWAVYALAASGLVASHVVPSAPGVRPRLIDLLGRRAYLAAYSLLSLLALAAFVWAYGRIGTGPWLYPPLPYARPAALALMPLAFLLVIGRLTTRPGPAPTGVYRLSRAPGSGRKRIKSSGNSALADSGSAWAPSKWPSCIPAWAISMRRSSGSTERSTIDR